LGEINQAFQDMGHGGARPGAGRKPGAITRATREIAERGLEGLTPLDFMLQIMRDEAEERGARFEAAKAAAPYVHAKLANVDAKLDVDGELRIIINKPSA
jgi:hypothetical protein